ncbi:4'-phosphopantetheinyl transferase superfamily protein [Pseudothauera rhizosphaerae]|uniref:4'-phosphopantetheinyl transferase superfamily protein n=2 Tax=Pseudothauera rhizosphaerae TaxID=2565932 RepID=A0A4S4ASF4_9RHOO|nr:4'-phosphopantetheinyl transferase superfamily protein [Pseudothauera rhizosphaerae]
MPRAARAERDWRVSRALAAWLRRQAGLAADAPVSLSHSRAHALAADAPQGFALGVDVELCRPRDAGALAQWVCTPAERALLDGVADAAARLEYFYVLWTLKEALLKAAGLDFPAGMATVGLRPAGEGCAGTVLRAPPGAWEAAVCGLPDGWIAAVAWRLPPGLPPAEPAARLRWLVPATGVRMLGAWRAGG